MTKYLIREQDDLGYLSYDAIRIKRSSLEKLKTFSDYKPWMDILASERIMSFGPTPYDKFSHAARPFVEAGLQEYFGHVGHWWRKLDALYPPSGQVKNFLNAALVADRVPQGGLMAILGSRYMQGSGDWIELLAHWLHRRGRRVDIHLYDPNEARRTFHVGGVRVVATAEAVDRRKLSGYHAIVDDVYVPIQGFEFSSALEAPIVSYKLYGPAKVNGVACGLFLHETEARFFSFAQEWNDYPTVCRCQRCKIEAYLEIAAYSDILAPSPCRDHIPEVRSMHVMWTQLTLSQVKEIMTPLQVRAELALQRLTMHASEEQVRAPVDVIVGYAPGEVPFQASKEISSAPIVVMRSGVMVDAVAARVSRQPVKGWEVKKGKGEWTTYVRPEQRRYLPPGKADVWWGGVLVESQVRVRSEREGVQYTMMGPTQVSQWCLLHRKQDECGLCTSFLAYPVCPKCDHRHGRYNISPFGVQCGDLDLTGPGVFQAFVSQQAVVFNTDRVLDQLVHELKGDPIRLANHPDIHKYGRWGELLVKPAYYFMDGRYWYYPWEKIRGLIRDQVVGWKEFVQIASQVTDSPWPYSLVLDPSSPLRQDVQGRVTIKSF